MSLSGAALTDEYLTLNELDREADVTNLHNVNFNPYADAMSSLH